MQTESQLLKLQPCKPINFSNRECLLICSILVTLNWLHYMPRFIIEQILLNVYLLAIILEGRFLSKLIGQ